MRIRQGNDFIFLWAIERDGLPEDFSNAVNVRLRFKNFDCIGEVKSFQIISDNIVRVEVSPEWASNLGAYRLILSYEFEDESLADNDRKCVVDVLAFNIVSKTCEADDVTEMAKTTDIMIGLKGDKGDKGDPFTYDDFTPEQIEYLKRPAVEAAEIVNNSLTQITAQKQVFESEAQEIKDAVANMTTTGKIYDSLADAIAENPKSEDGTPFSVMGDGDNDGYYKFDSTQTDGVKFGRKFDRRIQVESITQLRNYKGRTGEAVDVLGYYENGDGGGGLFYWDATSMEEDNGGTIIEADGVDDGRWKRRFEETIYVDWFGSKGNGVFDDSQSYKNALKVIEALQGGKIIFTPGKTYRITDGFLVNSNNQNYTPHNLHVVATGASIKATDEGAGTTIGLTRTENSSITGGEFDGNWDGGTGTGRWEGATGVIARDPYEIQTQTPIIVSSSKNCILQGVLVRNAAAGSISGSFSENITLKDCTVMNSGSHGFYFSFSTEIYSYDCKAFNIGRNNWGKGSVMFKMRDGDHCYLDNFYGYNEDPQAVAGASQGGGSHLYITNSRFINIRSGFYMLDPAGITNNVHLKNCVFQSSEGNLDYFYTGPMTDSSIENCEIRGFRRFNMFPYTRNIRISEMGNPDDPAPIISFSYKFDVKDVSISMLHGYANFGGFPGSVFENITFKPAKSGFLPQSIRLSSADSLYKNLEMLSPEGFSTTHYIFLIYADNITIDGLTVSGLGVAIYNNNIDGVTTTVKNVNASDGGSVIWDRRSNNTWYVHNVIAKNIGSVFRLYGSTNPDVSYANVKTIDSNLTDGSGASPSINHINDEGIEEQINKKFQNAMSGEFTTTDGKTITITNGIVTNIV